MKLDKAIEILKDRVETDRRVREGDNHSDFGKWAEEQCIAIETLLKEVE